MRLLVAIPTHDYHHYEFTKCLINLIRRLDSKGVDYEIGIQGGTLVYMARDDIAADAVNRKFDKILWLDADMVFEEDIFEKLDATGKQLVTGVYHGRKPPYTSCIFAEIMNGPVKVKTYPKEPFRVEGCGFGCILTDVEVFRQMYRKYGNCFQPSIDYGEDLEFCRKANQMGYELWCDPSVVCGHIGQVVVLPNIVEGIQGND